MSIISFVNLIFEFCRFWWGGFWKVLSSTSFGFSLLSLLPESFLSFIHMTWLKYNGHRCCVMLDNLDALGCPL